jgi:Tol biopolymer transport system component
MGEVYKARDTRLDRDVAIKILPERFGADAERIARFQREAKTLAALNHPNIAQIFGLEQAGDVHALSMELVAGEDLSRRIARGPIAIHEALPIARQIAQALEVAHEQGIVHRDLKPSNIKVRPDGTVKVLDFGLAKVVERPGLGENDARASTFFDPTLSGQGLIVGTAAYMSPEQAAGRPVDRRSDLWSFGVVLFEMLTGKRVFTGDTLPEVLTAVLRTPPDWVLLPPGLPPTITTLLRRCLEKDAAARVNSAVYVRLVVEDAIETPRPVPVNRDARGTRWPLAWVLMLAALVIVGAAFAYYRRPSPGPVTRLDLSTPSSGDPVSFALSQDGRQLVFVAGDGIESRLWLRPFDRADAQELAGTEGASYPFWAPTGRSIGFFADGKLKRFDIGGGRPQDLADAPTGRGGTWNQDNVIVFTPSITSALFRIDAAGGEATAITKPGQVHPSHRFPYFLPDGRRFLYLAAAGALSTQTVFLGSLDGDAPRSLTTAETAAAYSDPGYLLWVQAGALIARPVDLSAGTVGEPITIADPAGSDSAVRRGAFAVSTTGTLAYRRQSAARRQLVWLDRKGFQVGTVGNSDDAAPTNPSLAPNGRRIALSRTVRGNPDIWIVENERSVASRLTFDPSNDSAAVWSPDGQRIAFSSARNGVFDIFERATSGSGDERILLTSPEPKTPLDWSQDGRFLLFSTASPRTGWDLLALPLTGDRTPVAVSSTLFSERNGQFSPNGRWVAFESNESGRFEVSIQRFPGPGAKFQVSSGGGTTPRWRSNGRELFFVAPNGAMMSATLRFSNDGQSLDVSDVHQLFRVRIVFGGSPRDNNKEQYAVAPDGEHFLVNVASDETTGSPVTVVLNWLGGLRR